MGYNDQIPSYKSILGLLLYSGLDLFVTHWDTLCMWPIAP